MEALTRPFGVEEFQEAGEAINTLRTVGIGEQLVLEQNLFVNGVLPSEIMRNLTDVEFDYYLAPFREPGEGRRPTLTW